MDQITHVGQNLLGKPLLSHSPQHLWALLIQRTTIFSLGKKKIFLYISPKGLSPASWQHVIELVYLFTGAGGVLQALPNLSLLFIDPDVSHYVQVFLTARNLRPYVTTLRKCLIPKESGWDLHLFQALHCFPINATFLKQFHSILLILFTISTEQPSEMYHSIQKQFF